MRRDALIGFGMLLAATGLGLYLAPTTSTNEIARAEEHADSGTIAPSEAPFVAENEAAMTKMMAGMSVKPSGDVDRDFAAMMIPHHQGAIDMAQSELRYGSNEQLRRIAQEIIIDQLQEIDVMRLAVGQAPLPSSAAPTQPEASASPHAHHHPESSGGMMNTAPATHQH
jgi:hypothetical protein